MNYLINADDAKETDKYSIEQIGIPSLCLMEQAAYSILYEIKRIVKNICSVSIVTLNGNNGADGLALARMLKSNGIDVCVFLLKNPQNGTDEYKIQYNIIKQMNINCISITEENIDSLVFGDVIVDGIFGIGLRRNIEGVIYKVIEKINRSDGTVFSIDIPSGLDATNGEVRGISVKADYTVTFGKCKSGMYLCDGREFCGEIFIENIFPEKSYDNIEDRLYYLEEKDLLRIPPRQNTSNKGTYGTVNIVGGGGNMSGAVILSSSAAYRTGAGLVKVYAGRQNLDTIKCGMIEAVVNEISDFTSENINPSKDVIAIGPGLSTSESMKDILIKVLNTKSKKVIDADALNLMSKNRKLLDKLDESCILTPHIKEMSRLTGLETDYIRKNTLKVSRQFAKKYKCIVVLKDATTVITSGDKIFINRSGNSSMSKGGSGDVLSGIIAALLAMKMDIFDATVLGTYIHGLAGEYASEEFGLYSVNAKDIVNSIFKVMKQR